MPFIVALSQLQNKEPVKMLCVKRFDFLVIVLLALLVDHGIGAEATNQFPAPIKRCRVDDETCIVQQAQTFFNSFKNGIPELQVPSLEPIDLGTLSIESGGHSESLQFKLLLTNAKLYNLANSVTVKSVKGFSKEVKKPFKLVIVLLAPELEVHAQYDVNGKILILPIISKGSVIIKLRKMQAKCRVTVDPVKRDDGRTYLKVAEYKTATKIESGHFNMSNLFNDNVELRESTLKVLNNEWDALAVDIHPKLNEAVDRALKFTLQQFWNDIPYDEFFED